MVDRYYYYPEIADIISYIKSSSIYETDPKMQRWVSTLESISGLAQAPAYPDTSRPVAWIVERPCDPTFPRLFVSRADTAAFLNYCNVGPLPTMRPLFLGVAQRSVGRYELAEFLCETLELESFDSLSREKYLRDAKAILEFLADGSAAAQAPTYPVTYEQIETACAAYAEAGDYYVKFHRGLSSVSSDRMREGMRAALLAIGGVAQAPTYILSAEVLTERLMQIVTPSLQAAEREIERLRGFAQAEMTAAAWQYRVMFDATHSRRDEWCPWRDAGEKYFNKVNAEIAAGATRVQTRILYALSSTDRVTLPGHDETMANLDALTIGGTNFCGHGVMAATCTICHMWSQVSSPGGK